MFIYLAVKWLIGWQNRLHEKQRTSHHVNENIPKITILKEVTKGWTIVLSVVLYSKIWSMDNPLKDMAQLAA